jgi:hypothetical protein
MFLQPFGQHPKSLRKTFRGLCTATENKGFVDQPTPFLTVFEFRIGPSWTQFDGRRNKCPSKLFKMKWLVDAVGIEPTTCRLRVQS